MKSIAIIIFLLSSSHIIGQSIDISILKFKEEEKGAEPKWRTCNKDSAFYNSDTLTFSTRSNDCCDFVSITIRKKNITEIHSGQSCTEPPTITLTKKIMRGKIKKSNNEHFVVIYESGEIIKKFKIIELAIKHYTDKGGYLRDYYSMTIIKTT